LVFIVLWIVIILWHVKHGCSIDIMQQRTNALKSGMHA
jgi:hypothetical protein